ncbi:hypothetical protein ACXHJ2_10920 [Paenibacillus sp. ALE3]
MLSLFLNPADMQMNIGAACRNFSRNHAILKGEENYENVVQFIH